MSKRYDMYLEEHKANVILGMEWVRDNIPEYMSGNVEWLTTFKHDESKTSQEEYNAYDDYFYGNNKSFMVVSNFNRAWLHHIHNNPHHWQHWVLINDDPEEGSICISMPLGYIVEMICDWWSFSWANGTLYSIFDWYAEHKDYIRLHDDTRVIVEDILNRMRVKLDETYRNIEEVV